MAEMEHVSAANAHTIVSGADDDASAPAQPELFELLVGCTALSHEYADVGEVRLAVLAMWMSDLHALQLLLMENGLHLAPDPADQLASVGEALIESLSAASPHNATPRRLLERSREGMVAAFDESVHEALARRFLPLDHMDAMSGSTFGSVDQAVEQRLDGRTCEQLVAELEATAQDCVAVAEELIAANDTECALQQMYQADLASFEAFLLIVAADCGDETLVTVQVSWDLAVRADASHPFARFSDGVDFATAINSWRERLVVFGGWAQAGRMWTYFLPIPLG
ncbi:hypothetical protein BH09ACT10_BH09ACT10_10300 [soil metagenome]